MKLHTIIMIVTGFVNIYNIIVQSNISIINNTL